MRRPKSLVGPTVRQSIGGQVPVPPDFTHIADECVSMRLCPQTYCPYACAAGTASQLPVTKHAVLVTMFVLM